MITLAIIKYQILRGGNGTKKTSGVKIMISTMEVIPIINRESSLDLTNELQPAWAKAANRIMKKIIEEFKILNCKFSNN